MKINIYTPAASEIFRRIKFAATQTKSACADYGKGNIWILKSSLVASSFASLIVACCLFLCLSVNFTPNAVAAPSPMNQNMEASNQGDRLPPKVAKAVVTDLAKLQKIPPEKLKVVKYSQESWSDGCLGLPQPEEICSQAIVEGWRVVVSDGSEEWIYRTDKSGKNVRLESPPVSTN
jgi:hypothetical protein